MKLPHWIQVREATGPLTSELVRQPGAFGLGQVPAKCAPANLARAVCGFCSTGCGLLAHLNAEGHAVNLTPDPDYPVNTGMACPKGWEALEATKGVGRAVHPLLDGVQVSWETALQSFCERMKAVQSRHGAASAAFISTGQMMSEEMFFLGALAKFGMGMIHGDGNTRQCMATAVVAYKQAFGFDAPPFTYQDFEESDALIFVGANPCIAHPILWQRVMANRRSLDIVVIDPRLTETAMAATQHLALAPGADLLLFYCLAHWLIREGRTDHVFVSEHSAGFDAFSDFVQPYAPERYVDSIGVTIEAFLRFARTVARRNRVSFWWTMGVNQGHQAVRTAQAIINVALMTGNIGKPGTGANSITGQCNAMGSRLFSSTTGLPGGHDFLNPAHRTKIAAVMNIPETVIPDQNSLAYDQILEAVEDGRIKALWIICTNPAHSWINRSRFDRLREKLEFLVVQDMYATTETAKMADLLLPAAGWGEKEGTFINSERRIGLSRSVSRAPGSALSDFRIFQALAHAWGTGEMFRGWDSPESVFKLMRDCTRGQPCDISGIVGYGMLERHGGIQWPYLGGDPPQTHRRLFEDGRFYHPDGRARFVFDLPTALPEPVDAEYPLALLTGRGTSAQWHTGSRTGSSAILRKLYPQELWLDLHPADAKGLLIRHGDAVTVTSRRGSLTALARISPNVQPGHVFLPMHDPRVNLLTLWHVDPHSREPAYKHCAVRVVA